MGATDRAARRSLLMLLAVRRGAFLCPTLILAARSGTARPDISDKRPALSIAPVGAPCPSLTIVLGVRPGNLRIAATFILAARRGAARPGPLRSSTVTSPCLSVASAVARPGACLLSPLTVRSGVNRKAFALIARAGTFLPGLLASG